MSPTCAQQSSSRARGAALPPPGTAVETSARFMRALAHALIVRREVVPLGHLRLRYQRHGEQFRDDDLPGVDFETVATGVFLRAPTVTGVGCGEPKAWRWTHLGPVAELESLVEPYLRNATDEELRRPRAWLFARDPRPPADAQPEPCHRRCHAI